VTIDEAALFFTDHDNYILTSHESPDADGLGAQYALARGLIALGKRCRVINAEDHSPKYSFIDKKSIIKTLAESGIETEDLSGTTIVLVDTNDIHFTGIMADSVLSRAGRVFIFDHHEALLAPGAEMCSITSASSTCEMVYQVLVRIGATIETDMAMALLAGIVYDTGSFAWAKTSTQTFAAALELTRLGANPSEVHSALYESSTISVLLLRKAVLSTLELHHGDTIAFQTMTSKTLAETGASYEDGEDLINMPLMGKSVQVSMLFKENSEGVLRCSMRAKGLVNVAHIAQSFGGGGHRLASGFKSPYPLETIKSKVLEILTSAIPL
jgi:bifunctional oligoribonuclease and PAP phosphatase NrnA